MLLIQDEEPLETLVLDGSYKTYLKTGIGWSLARREYCRRHQGGFERSPSIARHHPSTNLATRSCGLPERRARAETVRPTNVFIGHECGGWAAWTITCD